MKITGKFYLKGEADRSLSKQLSESETLGVTQRLLADRIAGNRVKALEV